jgi:hypothetical protein
MGIAKKPHEVKLFAGLLAQSSRISEVEDILQKNWGTIDRRSEVRPFIFSRYYDEELGSKPMRWFCSFEKFNDPEEIREIKIQSNQIEIENVQNDLRQWNIDPGYVDLDKVVLVSTKPASYRVYLGKGIHAQSTLFYEKKTFCPWLWTYPDYREAFAIQFFNEVRKQFKNKVSRS